MLALLLVAQSLVLQPESGEPAEDLAPQVTRLVRQLDDRELARRDAAEQALIELGPAALPHLPPVEDEGTSEAVERLARVRLALQQQVSRQAAEASRITLAGRYTLEELFEEFEQQTGNKIIDYRRNFGQQPAEVELELDLENVEFWQALDTVLDEAELSIYPYAGEPHTLALTNRPTGQLARQGQGSIAGPFRVEPLSIDATRNLQVPASSSLVLSLQVAWEPRIQPIVITQSLETIEAVDEQGNAIEVALTGIREISVQGVATATVVPVQLEMPSREVQQIASLTGNFKAIVPGELETFEFEDLNEARDEELRKAGVVVTLVRARENGAVYEVQIRVRFDQAGDALASHRGWIFQNEAYMLDADGQRVEQVGYEQFSTGENEIGMSYKFLPEGDPAECSFVYRTPGSLIEMPIEFELTEISLP